MLYSSALSEKEKQQVKFNFKAKNCTMNEHALDTYTHVRICAPHHHDM